MHAASQGPCRTRDDRPSREVVEIQCLCEARQTGQPRAFVVASGETEAGYETSESERRMPSFSMRLRSVFGCRPRMRAAPRTPSINHPACSRAERTWRVSTSLRTAWRPRPLGLGDGGEAVDS